jgi:hypothetical protein
LLDEELAKANLCFIADFKGIGPFAVAAAAEKNVDGIKTRVEW